VGTCDVRPGRRPTGAALLDAVASYRRRAGISGEHQVPVVTTPAARQRPSRRAGWPGGGD
jgi:formate dehydrogenase major subunit